MGATEFFVGTATRAFLTGFAAGTVTGVAGTLAFQKAYHYKSTFSKKQAQDLLNAFNGIATKAAVVGSNRKDHITDLVKELDRYKNDQLEDKAAEILPPLRDFVSLYEKKDTNTTVARWEELRNSVINTSIRLLKGLAEGKEPEAAPAAPAQVPAPVATAPAAPAAPAPTATVPAAPTTQVA